LTFQPKRPGAMLAGPDLEKANTAMLARTSSRHLSAVIAAGALLCALTACSSGSPLDGSTPSPSPSAGATSAAPSVVASPAGPSGSLPAASSSADCADAEALRSSLEALGNVDVARDGVNSLNSAIDDVRAKLNAAAAAASSDLKPQLDQVRTALGELQSAASGVTAQNVREKAPAIAQALRQLATSTSELTTALAQRCPSS
jgi:hypothetical protein